MKVIKLHDDLGNVYVVPQQIASIKEAEYGTTIMLNCGKTVYCREDIEEVVERVIDCED